jgi:prolyl 4-hydroxylase
VSELSHLCRVYENVLDDDYCDHLVKRFEDDTKYKDRVESFRRKFSRLDIMDSNFGKSGAKGWEDDTSKITTIYKDIVERYKKDCKIDKYQFPEEWTWEGLRINKYEDNGTDEFFNHIDVNGHKAARRFLTIFCYLDDNVAGETDFPEFGWRGKLREKLAFRSPCKKGSVLLFPPMWPWTHRGNKPRNKPKYILQTYLHYV